MSDRAQTREQLLDEVKLLRARLAVMEQAETERQRTEAASREGHYLLRAIVETITLAVFVKDCQGRYLMINPTGAGLMGRPVAEVIGKDDTELFTPDTFQPLLEQDRRVMATGETLTFEYHATAAGVTRAYLATKAPFRDHRGDIVGVVGVARDITARKQAEEALQASEERFRAFMDNSPAMSVIKDQEGKYLYVSSTVQRFLGRNPADLIGKTVFDVLPRDEARRIQEQERDLFSSGQRLERVEAVPNAGGSLAHLLVFRFPFRDPSRGWLLGAVAVDVTRQREAEEALQRAHDELERRVRDRTADLIGANETLQAEITEHRRTEERLRKAEARLEEAQQVAHLGSWELEIATNRLFWSDELYRLLGLKPQGFEVNLGAFLNYVHPDDRELILQQNAKAIGDRQDVQLDYRIRREDGSARFIRGRVVVVADGSGRPVRLVGTAQDVTALKQSEESLHRREQEFRALVENAPDVIARVDRDFRHLYVNPATERATGFTIEQFLGRTGRELGIPEEICTPWEQAVRRVFESGGEQVIEFALATPDGPRDYQTRLVPELTRDRDVGTVLAVARDITELNRATEQVRESLRRQILLEREIHHRVKNNLQVVSSLLFLQSLHASDAQAREMLQESQSRIRSIGLVHEKLQLSGEGTQVPFSGYVQDLVAQLARSYGVEPDRVTINVRVEDVSLCMETAIPCGLIIHELVSNALKHAFVGRSAGEIRVGLVSVGPSRFMLTVADNGIGMPVGLGRHKAGSLGLQLVTDLIRQLDGLLELTMDAGTMFGITFTELKYKPRS